MTRDEEWDTITDFERSTNDVREAIREGLFIIAVVIVAVAFAWVFAAATGHA